MIIGLTGGIGCGKSTAARLFGERGFRIIDCDKIAHELLASDAQTIAEVETLFGPEAIAEDGSVDRKVVGRLAFGSPELLSGLEAVLHPRAREIWESAVSEGGDWVVEIPLLFEKNLQNKVDLTVCVSSHPLKQVERLEAIGMNRAQVVARMKRQMPLSEKAELADYVLLNDGSESFLQDQVDRLLNTLKTQQAQR